MVKKSGMISGCEDIDVCGTRIASPAFVRDLRYKASSVIRRPVFSVSSGGGKNSLRGLWLYQARMVRPQTARRARLGVWRLSNLLGDRGAPYRLSPVLEGEAREAGVACGQSVLQQAVCLFCGTALPGHDDQRRCPRNPLGLEDDQGARQAVHGGAATSDRNSSSQGHWGRRDCHTQGTYLSHRSERSFAPPLDLVWRPGPQRTEHGRVLQVAGAKEKQEDQACGHGHVEGVSQIHTQAGARARGCYFIRQVPCPASFG